MRTRVVPRYRDLSPHAVIELHAVDESTVLAVQRWRSRGDLDTAFSSDRFQAWWAGYMPTLRAWDELVVFDVEWEAEVLG
ncbi:hypothetical protein [Nocardioides aurantiacus]|uniref:hypothetical protein n=1 Tax=Nocardioides aurantiacus TaxID=86796 RepID=UPI0011CDB254|nr:hypothetical protein [Nocardioides aurantiacus]